MSLDREASERSEPVAAGLIKMITTYKFLATLYMMCDILPHLARLSCMFQSADIDLSLLQPQVSVTLVKLRQLRSIPGEHLSSLDQVISSDLKEWKVNVNDGIKNTFNTTICQPYIDALVNNISRRFSDAGIISAFSIFDPSKLPLSPNEAAEAEYGNDSLETLITHYGSGDSPQVSSDDTKVEWEIFVIFMINNCKTKTMRDVLQMLLQNVTLKSMYPNLSTLAAICQVLPVTTVDCERAFSAMKRIKSQLRSTMKTKTLNHLLLISIEGPELDKFDFNRALQTWGKQKNRRIL